MITRLLSEANLEDAKSVVRERFGESACQLLDWELRNPGLKDYPCPGDIVYDDDGVPICFQANIPRRVYLGQERHLGVVGGMTCRKKDAPVEAYIDIRVAADQHLKHALVGFGNSCNAESAAAQLRVSKKRNANGHIGPASCSRYLWRAIRPLECGMYFVRRKLLKQKQPAWKNVSTLDSLNWCGKFGEVEIRRLAKVEPGFFDVLMERYLKTNKGLCCSRTAEEIDWAFGERIGKGESVVLGGFDSVGPCGYILLKSNCFAKRWVIHDWFAIGNRAEILESLLKSACVYLRTQTPAMMLEVEGFPTWVQSLLGKYLPYTRKIGFNQFAWGSVNKELKERLKAVIDTPDSWFFGPYDGDECL